MENSVKIYSFYLPQFHTFPENDKWWGKGFTEWTNTKKASPLFEGHYQPHTPLDDYYYDLMQDPKIMYKQIELAKGSGVDGFCFYHYWFENGHKLMEKPIEKFLNSPDMDIEFCLCWANENWTRRWDGQDKEILIKQDYDDKNGWIKHFEYLKDFFCDGRYLKDSKGRPVLVIYKPDLISCINDMLDLWNKMAIKIGFNGLCFVYQYPNRDKKVDKLFDYRIEFEPIETTTFFKKDIIKKYESVYLIIKERLNAFFHHRKYKLYDYQQVAKISMRRRIDERTWPGVFPSWDNTARRGERATIFNHSDPIIFEKYLTEQMKKLWAVNKDGIIFINAWNEWAEGAHLEPDKKMGLGYLEAIKKTIKKFEAD